MDLKNLPKADLHTHLVGSLLPPEIRTLCKNADLSTAEMEPLEKHFNYFDPQIWTLIRLAISSPYNIGLALEFFLTRQAHLGVVYCETIINIPKILKSGVDDAILTESIKDSLDKVHLLHNIASKVRIGVNRSDGVLGLKKATEFIVKNSDKCFAGIDINGNEEKYPINVFSNQIQKLKSLGINYTIHSGEGLSLTQSLSDTIDLDPTRIGHGLALVSDHSLLEKIKQKKITVEVCLTSNLKTKSVNSLEEHPILMFEKEHIPYVICTDDSAIFNTDITQEYALLKKMGISEKRIEEISTFSLKVAGQ